MNQTSKFLVLLAALSLSLCGCTEKKSVESAGSTVAVKVNGQAISTAELDGKSGSMAGAHKNAISGQRINKIVDMELLRQAAVQSKMDADEKIQGRIASANRMILATAYMEKAIASIGKPTETEISAYYNQNPARFAERKQYEFQEFSIQPPPGKAAEIQAQLGKVKKFEEFEQWLTANKIPHGSTPVSVTSDRLPDDVLQKLTNVPAGGTAVMGDKDQMNVIFVLAEQRKPVALAQAGPEISNMLVDKRKSERLDNMVKQLREKAKIEYVPPYTANGLSGPVAAQ